jgi:hypothetical protein
MTNADVRRLRLIWHPPFVNSQLTGAPEFIISRTLGQ